VAVCTKWLSAVSPIRVCFGKQPFPECDDGGLGAVSLADNSAKSVLDDILADTRAQLADYKVPEWLEVVDEIPRNALGKINRKSLLAMTSNPRISRDG
jgi:acyl-CoA synthetase (AMP-forming)/AMP-acid ligase II